MNKKEENANKERHETKKQQLGKEKEKELALTG